MPNIFFGTTAFLGFFFFFFFFYNWRLRDRGVRVSRGGPT